MEQSVSTFLPYILHTHGPLTDGLLEADPGWLLLLLM